MPTKLYVAQVKKNNSLTGFVHPDPSSPPATKDGRIQIYIPELHYGFSADMYPWARQDREFSSFIPEIGDFVWVWFEDERNFKKPFYRNKIDLLEKHDHGKTIGSITASYPDVKYIYFANGVAIGLSSNTSKPEISIVTPQAEIYIDSTGAISIKGGATAVEPMVLGQKLSTWLSTHTHVGGTGVPTQAGTLNTVLSLKNKNN